MRALRHADGHDAPRLVDERVCGLAAVVAMVSQAVKTWVESPLSRTNCQMFSTGLSSGHLAGRAMMLMVPRILSLAVASHPA
jgi:hypothetical protein